MKPPAIPTIHLSPDTGTITNALDLAAWLRCNSPAWAATEAIARNHQMTRMETLELLALTLGLQLEQQRAARGFEICEARFVPPVSLMGNPQLRTYLTPGCEPGDTFDFGTPDTWQDDWPPLVDPVGMPETIRPKDPADIAPALLIGLGLILAIAAGVLLVTGHGLAAAVCAVATIAALVRASLLPV